MRAKIEVDVKRVLDEIGIENVIKSLDGGQLIEFFESQNATELGSLLKETMSPEALAELKAALG